MTSSVTAQRLHLRVFQIGRDFCGFNTHIFQLYNLYDKNVLNPFSSSVDMCIIPYGTKFGPKL